MTKKKNVPAWKRLLLKGWKVYNDGMNNKMFSTAEEARKAGYFIEGFASMNQTTHFTYRERYGRLH